MGILGTLRDLCFGPPELGVAPPSEPGRPRPRSGRGTARLASNCARRCQIEELEPRRLFAADVAPHVLLGSVYFEESTGDDSLPNIIQVSFTGGAAGTTLDHLTINGDKRQDGLTDGDVFFDTAAGGLGAFKYNGLSIVSANGFTVNGVTVVDGGTQIAFNLSGFDAGEKLVFSVDADEAQFVDGPNVDTNSLVEGGEFQRSIMVGDFSAPGYVNLSLTGLYWDAFDDNFAAASAATGLTLNLPNDVYSADHDYADRTAGAIAHAPQIPLASLAGWVYHDRNDDGVFAHGSEQGIGGVTLELLDSHGNPTGITTVTSTNPATLGFYEFRNLLPGTYGVREVQPDGWLDGKDAAGDHGGAAASEAAGRVDRIFGAVLNYGDHAVEYNFGELLPGSISGLVAAHTDADCDFDHPEFPLEGVRIDLLDGNGSFIRFTLTDENGQYEFNGLDPGIYQVFEHQPADYYEGMERVGTAGGTLLEQDYIVGINIGSDVHGINYDFCEHIGVTLSGNVYHDRDNDGNFDRPTEEGIGGVLLKLLDGNGHDTGLRATTDDNGFYKFNNLAAGTYAVIEIQPEPWLDGIDTPGNLGGVADVSPPGDMISQVTINWGENGTEYNFGEILPGSIAGRVSICDDAAAGGEEDIPIPNVRVDLLNGQGQLVATTSTNANGEYSFTNLRPGTYRVLEHQPDHYFDDEAHIGSGDGVIVNPSFISDIHIGSDQDLVNYDFCEELGAMLSGYVYHDRSNDGVFDRDTEESIRGVVLKLLDANGNDTGLRATTDATGFYKFNDLTAGKYSVMEIQPSGWLDGIDTPGNLGGVAAVSPPGDIISQVMINWGDTGTEYNFGELLPGSISGHVAVCDDGVTEGGANVPIPNVRVDLLNGNGQVVATTLTNADGEYSFTNLRPGTYSVREEQPTEYFDDEAHLGDGGGIIVTTNLLGSIAVGSDEDLENYDFCEEPPAELSGYVFIDEPTIVFADVPPTTEEIAAMRDGTRTPDDTPLPGVTLELRDGESGTPILVGDALPGTYSGAASDPIRVLTNSNGYYHFGGLRGGTYAVIEVQPEGVIDNVDTPGTTGGFAANPIGLPSSPVAIPTPGEELIIAQFRDAVGPDAVVLIPLAAGQHSRENNFSEVLIRPEPPHSPPPPPIPPLTPPPPTPPKPPVFPPLLVPPLPPLVLFPVPPVIPPPEFFDSSEVYGFTWHLSVVNAGWPRNVTPAEARFQLTSAQTDVANWQSVPLDRATWTLALLAGDKVVVEREAVFGTENATPVTGDFNGDGVTDIGVYIDGQWFLDLNGNGRWDEGDLWARLGSRDDLPVTGDWDADGKTDIGIFGPAWPRDPWAIMREPGLPDADNFPSLPAGKMKNMPPRPEDATDGARMLKRTARGKSRADLIDHVFHYGEPGDVPLAGDWNGDGIRQIGVFHDGQWYLDLDGDGRFTERDAAFVFGQAGDIPVVGDFNGDGVDDIGVYRAGKWILDTNGNRQLDAQDKVFELGGAGDKPVVGDWNDDGIDDPGVFHPGAASDHVARRAG